MPTHTAYEVPTGKSRMATARPTMLNESARKKTTDGANRRRPSDLSSAVAHTASSAPDTISTSQDMTVSPGDVLSLTGYGIARPGIALGSGLHRLKRVARR